LNVHEIYILVLARVVNVGVLGLPGKVAGIISIYGEGRLWPTAFKAIT
jgi:hypothetical protein